LQRRIRSARSTPCDGLFSARRHCLFTVYDGDFEAYVQDFLRYVGPLFDLLVGHTEDPPPTPVQMNPQEFVAWSKAHDLPSVHGLYSAYPDLSVQDVRALVAT
jgi:hypothetical protein